jgi:hypothetical protein
VSGRHALQEPRGDESAGPASPDSSPLSPLVDVASSEAPSEASIRVVAGSPSAEELAGVTAVLAALEAEEAAAAARRTIQRGPSGWQESQRSLRAPLHPGPGRWGRAQG